MGGVISIMGGRGGRIWGDVIGGGVIGRRWESAGKEIHGKSW